jgi:hypothetical protein
MFHVAKVNATIDVLYVGVRFGPNMTVICGNCNQL